MQCRQLPPGHPDQTMLGSIAKLPFCHLPPGSKFFFFSHSMGHQNYSPSPTLSQDNPSKIPKGTCVLLDLQVPG